VTRSRRSSAMSTVPTLLSPWPRASRGRERSQSGLPSSSRSGDAPPPHPRSNPLRRHTPGALDSGWGVFTTLPVPMLFQPRLIYP
jgi:hypothetical protein